MQTSTALLLAEPEAETCDFLQRHLSDDGFAVLRTEAWPDALDLAEKARPDIVLAGEVELCRRLRQGEPGRTWNREVPVIMLGGPEADAIDRLRAFERGCDDYVPKPFQYDELLARIRAVLRRVAPQTGNVRIAGELEIDVPTRCVRIAGERLFLPTKEFELLAKLAESPMRVFTKEELLREVWGFRSLGRTRTLDSHASRIRTKIAEHTDVPYVINVWGVGYRLMLPV